MEEDDFKLRKICSDPTTIHESKQDILKCMEEERVKQTHHASRIFRKSWHELTPEMFSQYPESPTARRYQKAFDRYSKGAQLLSRYDKHSVDDIQDCKYLQNAFHNYVSGYMNENWIYEQFRPPSRTDSLVEQYLKLCPDDVLTSFFKIIMLIKKKMQHGESDYEFNKSLIVGLEKFAFKLKKSRDQNPLQKSILNELYYVLCARYTATHQCERALDSAKHSHVIDPDKTASLYSLAFAHYTMNEDKKAKELFLQYTEKVPVCDEKYPNAYYMLAKLHLRGRSIDLNNFLKYWCLAEKAEGHHLQFLPPVYFPIKGSVLNFKHSFDHSKLSKEEFESEVNDILKMSDKIKLGEK